MKKITILPVSESIGNRRNRWAYANRKILNDAFKLEQSRANFRQAPMDAPGSFSLIFMFCIPLEFSQ
jgi:hypothetical protein